MILSAVSLCAQLTGRLHGTGSVHSVFRHAFNWTGAAGDFFTVLDRRGGNVPDSILVDLPDGFSFQDFTAAGDPVAAAPEALRLPGLRIRLENASRWNAEIRPGRLTASWAVMPPEPPDAADPFERRINTLLPQLLEALRSRDAAGVESAAAGLIGLGGGLTPTGDDILVGLIGTLKMAGSDPWINAVAERIAQMAEGKTTEVSAAALRHAAAGRLPQRLADYIAADSEEERCRCGERLRAVGHRSGCDMMRGVASAFNMREVNHDQKTDCTTE